MKRIFSNNQIYQIAMGIKNHPFKDDTYIPIKFNFYIQKNIETILKEFENIEKHKNDIILHYGELNNGQVTIPSDKIDNANKELDSLGDIKQEVDIYMIPLSNIEGLNLTTGELKSIMFMIDANSDKIN